MSDSYTKLFASITESTIWGEPAGTRLLWITFLAKANRHGEVFGSVPGMARLANISLPECEAGLQALLSPDAYSRTPDNEGRRIECIDGGWRILNHAKFDKARSQIEAEERERERKKKWDRENRPSGHARAGQSDDSPTQSDGGPTKSVPPPASTSTKAIPVANATGAVAPMVADPIWHTGLAFLQRKGVPTAQARTFLGKLKREAGDIDAAALLADAEAQDITEPIPWLSQGAVAARARASPGGKPGKQMQGLMALEGLKREPRMAAGRDRIGAATAVLPLAGPHTGR